MISHHFGLTTRSSMRMVCVFSLFLLLISSALAASPRGSNTSSSSINPGVGRIWLDTPRSLGALYRGKGTAAAELNSGRRTSLALDSADLDEDGIGDLVVGYATSNGGALAIHRGNRHAFAAPSAAALQAIAAGNFPAPYLSSASVLEIPVRPDFVGTGHFDTLGHSGIVAATKGGTALVVLYGTGDGKFERREALTLPGELTALAVGTMGHQRGVSRVLVGVNSLKGNSVLVFTGTEEGLRLTASYAVPDAPISFAFGNFGADNTPDAAVVAGGALYTLSGGELETLSAGANGTLHSVPLPFTVSAITTGRFLFDRHTHTQIAALASDGSLNIVTHGAFDARAWSTSELQAYRAASMRGKKSLGDFHGVSTAAEANTTWQVVETISGATTGGNGALLFKSRVTGSGPDDVVIVNPRSSEVLVFAHPGGATGARRLSMAYTSGTPKAALPARVNIDGRPGLVMLHEGQTAPSVMMPLPDPTYTVTTTADSGPGSLRDAIAQANGAPGLDTVVVPAGTYVLTTGEIDVTDSVNITGAGAGQTIISANHAGKAFSFNPYSTGPGPSIDVSISGLTIQDGYNTDTTNPYGGAFDFDAGTEGTGTLTITGCTIANNSVPVVDPGTTTIADGGGFFASNEQGTTPPITISNSTFSSNTAEDIGGAMAIGNNMSLAVSNSTVTGNKAQGQGAQQGGGIFIFDGTGTITISNSTFSNNQSGSDGGGVYSATATVVDKGAFSSNTSGRNGGGLWVNMSSGKTGTVTNSTFIGNSAVNTGGAIQVDSSVYNNFTLHYSRLVNNVASSASSALYRVAGTVNATRNWWGCNTSPATTPCNAYGNASSSSDYTPWIVLTNTASPSPIRINQSSTVTASFLADSAGGALSTGNISTLIGLSASFGNVVLGTVPQAQPETIASNGTAAATFNAGSTPGDGRVDVTVDGVIATATIPIVGPPTVTKAFGAANIAVNGSTSLTFTIQNPNTVMLTGVTLSDTFPSGLVVATPNGLTGSCGSGIITATAGSGSVTLSNGTLAAGTSCTYAVTVTAASDGVFSNTTGAVSSNEGGSGGTASATLTAVTPPSISSAFGAAILPLNGTTSLTFTLTSTNSNLTLNGVAFSDNLPAGLVISTPNNLTSTCGGTITAVAGGGSISLAGASLAPNTTCAVSVNVTGTTSGVKNNSVQASSSNGGTGNTSNASLTVAAPPVIIKAFGAASIPLNGSTSLNLTVQNNNTTQSLSGIAFSDTFPAGLVVATPNGLTGSCGGGTITATQATNVVSLTGATLAQNSSCTFSVNVTGTAAGQQNNTTGTVTSTNGGTGGTASASLIVVAPPAIAGAFSPAAIPPNGTTALTLSVTNPAANTVAETGVAFTNTLPAGLVIATPNGLSNTCGGTVTAVAGSTSLSLTGGSIAVNTTCMVAVNVTGMASGQYTNTSGAVTSTNGGTGNTATGNLTVANPPSITKTFGTSTIPLNGTTALTFNMTNPNTNTALTGIAFTDNLPAGMVIASVVNLSNTCGGTASPVAGSGQVSLAGGTLAANASCTVSVNVTGTTTGIKNNSVLVTSAEGGAGNTSNASLTVAAPPVIIKAFGAASIPLNSSTSLSFTVQNSNTTQSLTGIGFSDTFPAGLVVATPNGLIGSCGGGTVTATPGANVVKLSGGTLAASASCTFSVNVTGTTAGQKNNTTGTVTSTEGGTGGTASASLTVLAPDLTVSSAHSGNFRQGDAADNYTLTVNNVGVSATAAQVSLVDVLPAGLTATAIGGTGWNCTLANLTCTRSDVLAAGATYPVVAVTVSVAGNAAALLTNTATVSGGGELNTANNTATDPTTIVLVADLAIASTHSGSWVASQTSNTYTLTVSNAGAGATAGTVTVTDTLPSSLTATGISGTGWTCTLTGLSCTRSDVLAAGATYPAITLTVNVASNASGTANNVATVSGGGEVVTNNDTAADPTTITAPSFTVTPNVSQLTVRGGQTASFTLTLQGNMNFANSASFTCQVTGNATCDFSVPSSTVGVTPKTIVLNVHTKGSNTGTVVSGLNRGLPRQRGKAPFYGMLTGLSAVVLMGSHRRRKLAAALFAGMLLLAMASCGSSSHNTPQGSYPVVVTGSLAGPSGTLQTTTTVYVNVANQ